MGFEMPRAITNKDPVNKTVTFTQGLRTMTVYLDPWPDTDEEIEAQANAKLPSYTGDDMVRAETVFREMISKPSEAL